MAKGYLKVKSRGDRTKFIVHNWPRPGPRGFICSSRCHHHATLLPDDWKYKSDGEELNTRLNDDGATKGRVIFFIDKEPLGARYRRSGAGLLHLERARRGPVELFHVCIRNGLTDDDAEEAFDWLFRCSARLADQARRPFRLYLPPDMDRPRIASRHRLKVVRPEDLRRDQKGRLGTWLTRASP
jgi:hypothetical protein